MDTHLTILKQSAIFGGLENSDLRHLASLAEQRRVQAGETLATTGERAAHFFILISGTLLITMDKGKALVASHPGDFIGLTTLSAKGKYINTLTALTDGAVLIIARDAFLDFIHDGSLAGQEIMSRWDTYLAEHVPFLKDSIDTDHHF